MYTNPNNNFKLALKANTVALAFLSLFLLLSPIITYAAKNSQNKVKSSHVVTPPGQLDNPATSPVKQNKEPVTPPGQEYKPEHTNQKPVTPPGKDKEPVSPPEHTNNKPVTPPGLEK